MIRMLIAGPKTESEEFEAERYGRIQCEPYHPDQVAQMSLDVHLDEKLLVTATARGWSKDGDAHTMYVPDTDHFGSPDDPLEEQQTWPILMGEEGLVLYPGCLYLGATIERICAPKLAAVVHGKSSLARRGVEIHNAGLVECGYSGAITLELLVSHRIRVRPGMPIAQITFETVVGQVEGYVERGNYTGDNTGPVASKSHKHKARHWPKETP